MKTSRSRRVIALGLAAALAFLGGGVSHILAQATCGPFTDVSGNLCPSVLEIYTLGITTGTSATTYSPDNTVTRGQMARFLTRTVDQLLLRGGRRAALGQFWNSVPYPNTSLGLTTVGSAPLLLQSDGTDVWVANLGGTVSRVRASDGKLIETWTGATAASSVLVAMGRVFITGFTSPATLYMIDPAQPAGAVTTVANSLGSEPQGIAFDGARIWTANNGSVSIITPGGAPPWPVTTVSSGFVSLLDGILYDGSNVWVAEDGNPGSLKKLDGNGNILQSVIVGQNPQYLGFDGRNIWVPNPTSNTVSVVSPPTGTVLQTLSGNGLNNPIATAFDGQRILVTNNGGHSVSVFKAADLTPLGSFPLPQNSAPVGTCSDGVNFWIALNFTGQIARF